MKTVLRKNFIYSFDKKSAPVMSVSTNEEVVFEVQDALGGQIVDASSSLSAIDWNAVNPATGPVYVCGAEPGDVLKVHIQSIEIAAQGVVMTAEGSGYYGDRIDGRHFHLVKIAGGFAEVSGLRFPLNKMIGVIGVAPAGEGCNTGTPGSHGGNMDNKTITEGSILYLPVATPGALFALGDLHAVMADGEVCVTGVEIAGRVTVVFEVIKDWKLPNPLQEDERRISFIGSGRTLDEAADIALNDAYAMIRERTGLTSADTAMFLSLCGNLEICQIVDPLKTVRMAVAKDLLQAIGFTLPH